MKNELVSVIIPVYNSKTYLRECIESVTNQTYSNLEIILLNDGSTDDSGALCDSFAQEDSRIKVIHKENSGVSDTRNKGVEIANGKYILFVDSDDYIELNMIEKMIATIVAQNVDVVRCKVKRFNIKGEILDENIFGLNGKMTISKEREKIFSHILTPVESIAAYCCLLLIKKEKIVKFDCNLRFLEDTEFFVRLLHRIDSIYFMDDALYWYRYNEASATKTANRSIDNIYNLVDSIIQIKKDLAGMLTDELNKQINANVANLTFSKLKMLPTIMNFNEGRNCIKKVFNDKKIRNIILDSDHDCLSKIKRIELTLINKRLYGLLYFLINMSVIRKG